jgi:hypothetical protein
VEQYRSVLSVYKGTNYLSDLYLYFYLLWKDKTLNTSPSVKLSNTASEILSYLETHIDDPDNAVIGLTPNPELLNLVNNEVC